MTNETRLVVIAWALEPHNSPAEKELDKLAERIESAERERCANIAATYFEWHKPPYPEYCDGDPAEDISTKIRSGE